MQFRKLKEEFSLAIEFYCDVTSEHSCSTGMNKWDKNWRIYTDDFQHKEVNFQLCIEFSLTILWHLSISNMKDRNWWYCSEIFFCIVTRFYWIIFVNHHTVIITKKLQEEKLCLCWNLESSILLHQESLVDEHAQFCRWFDKRVT